MTTGASSQVPKSYLVGTWIRLTRYKVKSGLIANGGFADIRAGRLRGMVVAVKTICTSSETKIYLIYEVRNMAGCSVPRRLINMAIEPRPPAGNVSFG